MHEFNDLIYRSTTFTLNALEELNRKTLEQLQTSAATSNIKNLQMIQLQKAILAIGMFSLFESILQERLKCSNGLKKAQEILENSGKTELLNRLVDFKCAINVLKHGRGRSYNSLVYKSETLSFKIKLPGEKFFFEGDVSEISTLIKVDDKFVLDCAELIKQVANEIKNECSLYFL